MQASKKSCEAVTLRVRHLLQEQSRTYFLSLPKLWVKAMGLRQGSPMILVLDGPELRVFPENREDHNAAEEKEKP